MYIFVYILPFSSVILIIKTLTQIRLRPSQECKSIKLGTWFCHTIIKPFIHMYTFDGYL